MTRCACDRPKLIDVETVNRFLFGSLTQRSSLMAEELITATSRKHAGQTFVEAGAQSGILLEFCAQITELNREQIHPQRRTNPCCSPSLVTQEQ
jgi:hypothetical protein